MDTRYSDRCNAAALDRDWELVCEEAEAFADDETMDKLAVGFDLAMKLVQMSALSKYIGADLKVWAVSSGDGLNATAYFVASCEEEVLSRIEPLP